MSHAATHLRRLALVLAVVVAAVVVPGAPALAAPSADGAAAPIAPGLEAKAASGEVPVIAVTRVPGEQVVDEVVADLPGDAAASASAGQANLVAVTVDEEGLDALAASPEVVEVVENKVNRISVDPWAGVIGVPATHSAGWNGTGRTIAVLDTGVQTNHPYLAGAVVGEACFSQATTSSYESLCPGGSTSVVGSGAAAPCDPSIPGCDHGTHVAGIAAGGPVSSPSAMTGVGPGASIIAVKVFSKGLTSAACGGGAAPCVVAFDSELIAALSWLEGLRAASDPLVATLDAVNLSLGGGLYSGVCDGVNSELTSKVSALRARGIATVVASGNNGQNGRQGTSPRMSSPACISTSVSVGASTGSGAAASFGNLTAATTLLAPGSSIVSSVPTSTYGTKNGTSMATPMVAGAFADLRQKLPSIRVDTAVALLRSSGDPVSTPVGVLPELQLDEAVIAPGSPFGSLDSVTTGPGSISVAGWAIDPETAAPIPVHVYVGGVGHALTAAGSRPDVDQVFGYGSNHGFAGTFGASGGAHQVCAYAINTGVGGHALLGCRVVTVPSGSPFGTFDWVGSGLGTVSVAGWAIDPDTTSSIPVHVYVDGAGYALEANGSRPDVAAAFPGFGPSHGFGATVPAAPGSHTVCAYAINAGVGSTMLLGCRSVVVPGGSPFGSLDVAARNGNGSITVAGWSIDPDTAAPIEVHVYFAGSGYPLTGVPLVADGSRPDVGAAFPLYGSVHGFSMTTGALPPGITLCAYGINTGSGGTSVLGCRTVP